ncbi:Fic family protein [Nocardioidaceae bacterium SCSIO 66511]|nr:Fic family protein [Nocardioidaceae bacterium SCSIO 66511]
MAKDRSTGWPEIGYERHPWRLDERATLSRTQRNAHLGPYDAAVVPRLSKVQVALPASLLAEAEDARVAIARFDAYVSAKLDRDGTGSEIGPMASILLRSESSSSSQIEQITVGARQLAMAELGERASGNARLVARNVSVMRAAVAMADRLDGDSILRMHRTLLDDSDPAHAGRWRAQQVWIGGTGAGPHLADFVPPHQSRVVAAITDLVDFIGRDDVPALAHAALAHAQFETIHPFTDGNGRTGRALLQAMLRSKGVTERATIPVSAGLLTDTDAYFRALTEYRAGDPAPIVGEVVRASLAAIDNGRELVESLDEIRAAWSDRLRARRDASVWRVVDLVLHHPVINNEVVRRELHISDVAAQGAIEKLVEVGALTASEHRARNRLWQSPEVIAALDAFAARARRRRTSR